MFLLRFLYRVFIHPTFLILVTLMVGAFWAATNPDVAELLNAYALTVWRPEAAPAVFRVIAMVLLALAFGFFVDAIYGLRHKPIDPVAAEARRAEAERSVADQRATWEASRVKLWRGILEDVLDEGALSELDSMLRIGDGEGYGAAEYRQEEAIMNWLLRQAIALSAKPDAGLDVNQAKIHKAVDQVLRIAATHDAWLSITYVAGAKAVVVPVFIGQAAQYESRCHQSQKFLTFVIWATRP